MFVDVGQDVTDIQIKNLAHERPIRLGLRRSHSLRGGRLGRVRCLLRNEA